MIFGYSDSTQAVNMATTGGFNFVRAQAYRTRGQQKNFGKPCKHRRTGLMLSGGRAVESLPEFLWRIVMK